MYPKAKLSALNTSFVTFRQSVHVWQNNSTEMVPRWQRIRFFKIMDHLLETLALDCTKIGCVSFAKKYPMIAVKVLCLSKLIG